MAAAGRTTISARAAIRSRRGPAKYSATLSPSACWACPRVIDLEIPDRAGGRLTARRTTKDRTTRGIRTVRHAKDDAAVSPRLLRPAMSEQARPRADGFGHGVRP